MALHRLETWRSLHWHLLSLPRHWPFSGLFLTFFLTFGAATGGDSASGSIGGIRTPGGTKISSGGAAANSISIVVPPGTAGVQPNLSFNYNSQGENRLLGIGWSVGGLAVIHRCPRTVAQDGFRGGVNYDGNDRFCLDGQRLMTISGAYGGNLTEYRTEIDSFLKIISFGSAGSGPAYFKVWTKGGETMEFGNTANSAIEAQGKASIRVWALNKVSDVKGNYLTLTYAEDSANGEYHPTEINYTYNDSGGLNANRKVVFGYNENGVVRSDQTPQWIGGSKILTTKLLTSVKTYANAALVRDYRLEYEVGTATKRDRLKGIKECDANGNCLPANTPVSQPAWQFAWREGLSGAYQMLTTGAPNVCGLNRSWVGDYNADGKSDWLCANSGTFYTFLSNGNGTYQQISTSNNTPLTTPFIWEGDFNGDGRTDLLSAYYYNFYTNFSNGDGTFQKVVSPIPSGCNYDLAWGIDLNGDGKTDLLCLYGGNFYSLFSNGDGSFQQVIAAHTTPFLQPFIWIGDFNGDGKIDVLNARNYYFYTNFSNGDGTFQKVVSPIPSGCNYDLVRAMDLNGDGKTDLLCIKSGTFYSLFSKGDGTYQQVTSPNATPFLQPFIWAGDFNGDGKMDLLSAYYGHFYTNSSKGDGTYTQTTWAYPNGCNLDVADPGDFNGDGKSDLMCAYSGSFFSYSATGAYPDLLTNITNPFGGQNAITYKPLTDNSVYAKDSGVQAAVYPIVDLQFPLYVVSNLGASDGLGSNYTTAYTYGGAKAHHLGRGGLGFRWTESNDLTSKALTREFMNQAFPFTGTSSEAEVYDTTNRASPVLFVETWNTYVTPAPNPYTGVYFVQLQRTDAFQYDGQGTPRRTARTTEYDTYGNPTRVLHLGDVSISGDERDERNDWAVNVATWLHRPKRIALYDHAASLVREQWLYYDNQAYGVLGAKGLVTKEEANAGGGIGNANNPVVTHAYDAAFGVKTSVTDARGCTTTTVYEATKTFPQTVTNCLSHGASYVYSASFGVKTSETDANSQTTTYGYDSFGRLKKIIGPLDSSTHPTINHDYLDWGNPALQRVVTHRREQHGTANVLSSEDSFDGLGRADQTSREGPGGQTITTEKIIDSRGLVLGASAPHFAAETAKFTTYQYDVLGRQTRLTHADGTFETAVFVPGMVTLTDERGKVKRKYFDAYGQLKKVDEINGADTYVTTYAYDAAGSLTTVINHLGHTTRMTYDILGRKIFMCDPNMGTASGVASCTTGSVGAWVYTYNKAGDLLTQKDAKNQTITFTYDSLGRPLTKKQGTTSLLTWSYDNPVVLYSKGKVTQIVDQATTTKFAYDQLGRITQTQRLQLGVWYTMAQQYDALSRIISETFPDTETIAYTYNEAGWLSTVPGYINGITYNARGQKTALTYANNLTTNWTFNANNFRVTNRTTSNNQQNLTYGYDNNGNITSITDTLFTASRSFQYDDLNRLINGSGTFGSNQSQLSCIYGYNAIGNITNKCGTLFSYGNSMHPSAVTFNPLTNKSHTYDANGNMLTRGNQTLNWNIDNRVSSVAVPGGGTTHMEYDYSGARIKKNAPSGITLYPFQGYEIDPNGTITKFFRIGIEIFASKKKTTGGVTTQYFYHNDHLGGVNVITNIAGTRVQLNEYDPWGSVSRTVGSIDPTHRFNGKELDPESGLYYYGGRYYDSEISRFISADPFIQSPDDPQSLNRYSYVVNNPQNYIDPSGYFFKKLFKSIGKIFKTISSWHHRIFVNVNLLHLSPSTLGVREFSRGTVKSIYNYAEGVVVSAIASYFTAGALGPTGWGLSGPMANAIGSAASGAVSSTLRGENPVVGAVIAGAFSALSPYGDYRIIPVAEEGETTGGMMGRLIIGNTVRAMSAASLIGAGYSDRVISTFEGPINRVILPVPITVYRYFGGTSPNARGVWLTTEKTFNLINALDISARAALALPPGATAENVVKWIIPKNTEFLVGGIKNGAAWATQIFLRSPGMLQRPGG